MLCCTVHVSRLVNIETIDIEVRTPYQADLFLHGLAYACKP
jgi:hypothetical protein